jgi:DNA-binding MarR family transcriptional regulator
MSSTWPTRILRPLSRHLHQICDTVVAEAIKDADLTLMEFNIIAKLGDVPDIDQNTLADHMAIDRTSVSTVVYALEQRKLIEREVCGDDRRSRTLRLTKTGELLRARYRPKSLAAQQRVLATLTSEERETLLSLLVRVVQANEEHALPGAGRKKPTKSLKLVSK